MPEVVVVVAEELPEDVVLDHHVDEEVVGIMDHHKEEAGMDHHEVDGTKVITKEAVHGVVTMEVSTVYIKNETT